MKAANQLVSSGFYVLGSTGNEHYSRSIGRCCCFKLRSVQFKSTRTKEGQMSDFSVNSNQIIVKVIDEAKNILWFQLLKGSAAFLCSILL